MLLWPFSVDASIQLSLSRAQCQPGDVVELYAESAFEELRTFELKLPQHEALHLVAHQRQPVLYADGIYRQKDIWVLQAKKVALIELAGVVAIIQAGETISEVKLPVQRLEVIPYGSIEERFELELLTEEDPAQEEGSAVWWIALLAVSGLTIATIYFVSNKPEPIADESAAPTLDDLRAAFASGDLSVDLVEQLLAEESPSISEDLYRAMERFVYGGDSSALVIQLEEEASQ
ncbi:MAG: hypothetical protein AAF065_13055 [Verrucomicrobiota bacterium]